MSLKPRWYWRFKSYNRLLKTYKNLLDRYENGEMLNYESYHEVFNKLKICYVLYYKCIKDALKAEYNITEYLPKKILQIAQSADGGRIIDDGGIWINYIQDVNELCQSVSYLKICTLTKNIIEKYKNLPEKSKINLDNFSAKFNIIDDEIQNEFDINSKPLYKASDIGLSEHSYKIFLNCLRKNDYINYVWIHGSRTKNNARKYSDLDLIIDLPTEKEEELKKQFRNLYIPYRIDFVSSTPEQNEEDTGFIRTASIDSMLIYRKKDFE